MSTFGREEDEKWRKQQLKIVSSNDEIGWRGHIKHASRLRDVRYPEPAYVVPGFIPEGLSILGGRPKVGKSWLALELALGVSRVETVLGKIMPESGDVLYAALEDTFPRLQRRIKKLLWPGRTSWPARQYSLGDLCASDLSGIAKHSPAAVCLLELDSLLGFLHVAASHIHGRLGEHYGRVGAAYDAKCPRYAVDPLFRLSLACVVQNHRSKVLFVCQPLELL